MFVRGCGDVSAGGLRLSDVVTQPKTCEVCGTARAALRRPKTGQSICRQCFFAVFEDEVHRTIVDNRLFNRGDRVAIAASGGKGALPWRVCVCVCVATRPAAA